MITFASKAWKERDEIILKGEYFTENRVNQYHELPIEFYSLLGAKAKICLICNLNIKEQ